MESLEYNQHTKEEILEQIEKKAISYVPEWRFDMENRDIGTALAMVYAEMLAGTVKKMNYLPYKNQISFFNTLEAELLPAMPSKGYITFSVVNKEVHGEEIPEGMEVVAQTKIEEKENISFETMDDIFVTSANLECILEVSVQNDYIGEIYNQNGGDQVIKLFSQNAANMQEHSFYLAAQDAFFIKESGKIVLEFSFHGENIPEKYLEILGNPEYVIFEYSSEEGYVPFQNLTIEDNKLVFSLERGDIPFTKQKENEIENFWIRCKMQDITPLQQFCFDSLQIASSCERVSPDNIYANGQDVNTKFFFPFGERFLDYNEVYFSSEEVFRKKGAVITIAFTLDFIKIPLEYQEETNTEWEWIMKKSDFKLDMEFDITIGEVVWEYYNGHGWAVLFKNNEYGDLFSTENGMIGQYKKITFICPQDMKPILMNAYESYYIRARVTKVSNLYKMKGNYISPVIGNVLFQYDYSFRPVMPDILYTKNNRECKKYYFSNKGNTEKITPFYSVKEKFDVLYFGFDCAVVGGPIKILFDVMAKEDHGRGICNLSWEYYNGNTWVELDLVDETKNFTKTGIVTLMGMKDSTSKNIYGYNRYWIRIKNMLGNVARQEKKQICLNGIYMNSVKVRQKDREETEYFHMEVYQENVEFSLIYGKVYACDIYVDEIGHLSRNEMEHLKKIHKLYPDYRENGEMERAWVKWKKVDDFLDSHSDSRHFVLDPNKGVIRFGNGKNGRIPPTGIMDNIKVIYKVGGGEFTNVPAGAVTQLGKYIGFINEVKNLQMFTGGCDLENLSDALNRNAAVLRHQNIAITARDFEEIAKDASRSIKRVKCFSGLNNKEEKQSGAITLVVLQKEFGQTQSRFQDVKIEVENYMKDKINSVLWDKNCFYVIEPKYVELRVRAEVLVEGFEEVFHVKKQILKRLNNFINPLVGNFDGTGWDIGTLPNVFQIRNAISDIEGLQYIKNIYISVYCMEDGKVSEVDLSTIVKSKYILPVSGEHDIIIRV